MMSLNKIIKGVWAKEKLLKEEMDPSSGRVPADYTGDEVSGIMSAKKEAGPSAFLWVHSLSGEVILWPDEASSKGDPGVNALKRWTITPEAIESLVSQGAVDYDENDLSYESCKAPKGKGLKEWRDDDESQRGREAVIALQDTSKFWGFGGWSEEYPDAEKFDMEEDEPVDRREFQAAVDKAYASPEAKGQQLIAMTRLGFGDENSWEVHATNRSGSEESQLMRSESKEDDKPEDSTSPYVTMAVTQMIDAALKDEEEGARTYKAMANVCDDEAVKKMFLSHAKDEEGHAADLKKVLTGLEKDADGGLKKDESRQVKEDLPQMQQVRGRATSVATDPHAGYTVVTYHATPVVKFNEYEIILNTGGWKTYTTKTRMNQASHQYNLGYSVNQYKGKWVVDYKEQEMPFEGDSVTLKR
jgi:hypothetical protein